MSQALGNPAITVRAPGKINVFLAVGCPSNDGYHELATAFQAVSLYDDVTVTAADEVTLSLSGLGAQGLVPPGEDNLAVRAARALAAHAGVTTGAHLHIHKTVPVAGGMGGGSADAAAALVACDALWETGLSTAELHDLAAQLGADVPFALRGGTAIGTGRGDTISPALARGTFHWVLVVDETGLATASVYQALDDHRQRHRHDISPPISQPQVDRAVLTALRAGDPSMLAESMSNDLQAAALHLRPDLAAVLEAGESAGAIGGIVSGSGPTMAFLAEDAAAAEHLSRRLTMIGFDTIVVHGPVPGARPIT